MTHRTLGTLFVTIFAATSLLAEPFSISPESGPTTGGTTVTIKGDFATTVIAVLIGGSEATDLRRIDEHTLRAVTPVNLPGRASIDFLQFPLGFPSQNLSFTYVGDVPETFERLLLPIFVKPVRGQYGSEFVSAFTAQLQRGEIARLFGLTFACRLICPPQIFGGGIPVGLSANGPRLDDADVDHTGNPGRFLFVPKDEVGNVAMNLRVFDRSRSAQNYGTEIPIVRQNAFVEGSAPITLLNVPTDTRSRRTLRIYADVATRVNVRVDQPTEQSYVPLPPLPAFEYDIELAAGRNVFEPATATFTDFPANIGLATVTITIPAPPVPPPTAPRVWAFITVTNNDTQLITTITPQP